MVTPSTHNNDRVPHKIMFIGMVSAIAVIGTVFLLLSVSRERQSQAIRMFGQAWSDDNAAAVVRYLQEYDRLTETGEYSRTWLHQAAAEGKANIVKGLVNAGFSPAATDSIRWTPLKSAIRGRHYSVVTYLLSQPSVHADAPDGDIGPFHVACQYGPREVVALLHQKGARVAARDHYGQTPLLYATIGNNVEVAQYLLDHGADVNVSDSMGGTTPLICAITRDELRLEMVQLLLERGADVEKANKSGDTPMDMASARKNDKLMKLLMKFKCK